MTLKAQQDSFSDWTPIQPTAWYDCTCGHFDQVSDESGLCSRCKAAKKEEQK